MDATIGCSWLCLYGFCLYILVFYSDLLTVCAVQTEPFDWPSSILCEEDWSLPSLFATLSGEWFIRSGDGPSQTQEVLSLFGCKWGGWGQREDSDSEKSKNNKVSQTFSLMSVAFVVTSQCGSCQSMCSDDVDFFCLTLGDYSFEF